MNNTLVENHNNYIARMELGKLKHKVIYYKNAKFSISIIESQYITSKVDKSRNSNIIAVILLLRNGES